MNFSELIKSIKQEYNNYKKDKTKLLNDTASDNERWIVDTCNKNGVCAVPGFISTETVSKLKQEVDRLMSEYSSKLWVDEKNSDHRAWGINLVSELIDKEFHKNESITRIISTLEGKKIVDSLTLAGKLTFVENNEGSGGGWHRDRADYRQTKAILYLTDVELNNGPFQYISGSHRSLSYLSDQVRYGFKTEQKRFSNAEIEKMVENSPEKLLTFTAKAGTVIFTNTRGIHRGVPITSDERYALTNYYWVDFPMHPGMKNMSLDINKKK